MALTIIGIFLGTLAEAIGFILWQQDIKKPGASWLGLMMLIVGGLVGWYLTALLVRYSPASHARQTKRVSQVVLLVLGLAIFKVILWLTWHWLLTHSHHLLPQFPLTVATAFLLIGFHIKHVIGIVFISGRSILLTTFNPITILATVSAAGGAGVWYAMNIHGYDVHACFVFWLIYAFVENVLQFAAGGLFDPPAHAQSPFSIVTQVERNQVAAVQQHLAKYTTHPREVRKKFHRYTRLHFCSFILLEHSTDDATLVFEGNIDGPPLKFLEDLASEDREFLDRVYAGSVEYPQTGTPREVADFLAKNDYGAAAMYVGQPGATRDQIERDERLRELVESELDDHRDKYAALSAMDCHKAIQKFVETKPEFAWTREPVPTLLRITLGLKLLYAALGGILIGLGVMAWATAVVDGSWALVLAYVLLIAVIGLAAFAYWRWLRRRENTDKENRVVAPLGALRHLQVREDVQLQNHLVSLVEVKPSFLQLRFLTMRAVLAAIDLLAKYFYTRGNMSGIVTIHFARWVVLMSPNRGPRLLFLSNYDGTWENYLGEFIDRAVVGLTAIWSNTQLGPDRGFPKTEGLFLRGGARDEQWFKNYARLSQQTDLLWYSAYPHLTMKHIANNREFRLGLHRADFKTEAAATEWLQRL